LLLFDEPSLLLSHLPMALCKVAGKGTRVEHESHNSTFRTKETDHTHASAEGCQEVPLGTLITAHSAGRLCSAWMHVLPGQSALFFKDFSDSFSWPQQCRTGHSSLRKSGPCRVCWSWP
jgi:hypothetical protein